MSHNKQPKTHIAEAAELSVHEEELIQSEPLESDVRESLHRSEGNGKEQNGENGREGDRPTERAIRCDPSRRTNHISRKFK